MNQIIERIENTPINELNPKDFRINILLKNIPIEQKEMAVKMFHEGINFVFETQPQIIFMEDDE